MSVQGLMLLTYVCVGSLFAITGVRQLLLAPWDNTLANLVWFVIQVLPLLATLPGLMRGQIRSTFLLCLFALLYFVHGIMVIFEPELRPLGIVEACFALGLCTTTTYLVRRLREAEAAAENDPQAQE